MVHTKFIDFIAEQNEARQNQLKIFEVPLIFFSAIIGVIFFLDFARTCLLIFGVSYCIYTVKFIIMNWIELAFGFFIRMIPSLASLYVIAADDKEEEKKEKKEEPKPAPVQYLVKIEEKKLRLTIKDSTEFNVNNDNGPFKFTLKGSKTITLDGACEPGQTWITLPADTPISVKKGQNETEIRALGVSLMVTCPSGSFCSFSVA